MLLQNLYNPDSLKAVKDSVNQISSGETLNKLTFDISNVFDKDGILITVVGYVVVFIALFMLYLIFFNLSKFLIAQQRKKLKAEGSIKNGEQKEITVSGEINAAISMALFLYFEEFHDYEDPILTIKKVQRPYSPWSSKIYGLREYPQKN